MDKEGKDTYRIYHAGADSAYISSPRERAYLSKKKINHQLFKNEQLLYDITIIEGYKDENLSKYIISTYDKIKNEDFSLPKYSNLLGIILDEVPKNLGIGVDSIPVSVPQIFGRDDVDGIYNDLVLNIKKKKPALNALILVGGKSSRMGEDKGILNYNGKSQVDFLYDLLSPFINDVFVSVNSSQKNIQDYQKYNIIEDKILEIGPIGGVISSFMSNRDSAWLVVACDIPLINQNVIKELIDKRNFLKAGTFFNSDFGFEPLVGIYEPKSFPFLLSALQTGKYGIKNAFNELELNIIDNNFTSKFKNINTKKEKEELDILN
jgi:molybdopterin-guanine dinucleotide biosynthesis protein A